ncbi:hypothetical protein AU210_008555 [Fusarium oxysporum f. sp. radicis-cucumerinum]|uniref:Metallo-beta-lactamase domain-containing protein n=1 Tax=Fusarium oxysporum f. sp. radicis-cucumerinum TaxID=327505 RepID=A0A2H3H269_FUSOX|nr:hypothetical protein AU210_008555 [Fusarium oxysporum f. sp. radicis-cucumerinum]
MPSSAIIIPPSETFVDVSIIDTKSYFGPLGVEYFLKPGPVGAHKTVGAAFYCFLVHHKPSNTRLLFDLALRKDVENLSRSMRKSIEQGGWEVNVPTDIADILSSNTVPLESINGIVWSHHHWDHIGDPSTFPSTTSLIVGSGFKDEFLPAYPENPDSPLTQDAILGRKVVEPDFKSRYYPDWGLCCCRLFQRRVFLLPRHARPHHWTRVHSGPHYRRRRFYIHASWR